MLIKEKVAQAIDILKEQDVDCWITFVRETAINGDPALGFLLSAGVTWQTAVILTSKGDACVICGEYDRKTIEDIGVYQQVTGYVKGMREPLLAVMRRVDPRSIALNYSPESEACDGLTHGMYLNLLGHLGALGYQDRVVSAEGILSALRARKTAAELSLIKQAIRTTEAIFAKVAAFISPGRTEREIAAFMTAEVDRAQAQPAWDPSHCPAVFTGPESAGAHYAPTERQVQPGHLLNMDFGVKQNGYCSDLQRTFYILGPGSQPVPPEVKKGFETIVEAIESSRKAMRPGVTGAEIDTIARRIITSAGFEEFPHALGHQVGRFAHDGTALLGPAWEKYGARPFAPLEAGMVFTLEPRLTVEGHGVATLEEMVVLTDSGAEYLSTPQQELILVR